MWFRPLVARRLKSEGVATLGELIDFCNRRGGSWWRAVPRIGAGRARHIVACLRQHEDAIGRGVDEDVDPADPLAGPAAELGEVDGSSRALVPLERMAVSGVLSGIDGANRAVAFPYISAHHDLDAVRAYLYRFRQQPKTLRAYTKELERFLLWSLKVRQKPLSSLLVDDCEAYKDFLNTPDPAFVGPKAPRLSGRWEPFASAELTAESQKYAVRALRAAFAWLVNVRYLAGNPWAAVTDPVVVEREAKLRVVAGHIRIALDALAGFHRRAMRPRARQLLACRSGGTAARWRFGIASRRVRAGPAREHVPDHLRRSGCARLAADGRGQATQGAHRASKPCYR